MPHQEQRQRTTDLLKSRRVDRALFTKLHSVTWLTGFVPLLETGPIPFAPSPVVWYEGGNFTLIISDSSADYAKTLEEDPDCDVITYRGYTIEAQIAVHHHLDAVLKDKIDLSGRIGIERFETPAYLAALLPDAIALDGLLEPLRMIKTDEEIQKLRENFALTDLGHATARETIQIGKTELDVWLEVEVAIQKAAKQRLPIGNDCVVGYRSPNNIGGYPLDYKIHPQDSLTVDISTLKHGYWSDSCMTYYAGEPTEKQKAMHRTVQQALDFAISLLKPGAIAKEVDQKVRQFIKDAGYPVYPHHTGHSVGVSGHESPRIVPYNDEVIQTGMVLMVEPGIYFPGETSVRLEDAVLVQADGVEILTNHDKSLP